MPKKEDYNLIRVNHSSEASNNTILVQVDKNKKRPLGFVFVEKNPLVLSFLSLLFLPYILGMILTLLLFYFYVGVGISDFFHVYSGLSQFLFWILGSYLMITLFDIWFLTKKLMSLSK